MIAPARSAVRGREKGPAPLPGSSGGAEEGETAPRAAVRRRSGARRFLPPQPLRLRRRASRWAARWGALRAGAPGGGRGRASRPGAGPRGPGWGGRRGGGPSRRAAAASTGEAADRGARFGRGAMRGPAAWPLRLLLRRGPAARAPGTRPPPTLLAPARLGDSGPSLLEGGEAARAPRCRAVRCPGGGPGSPAGGAGLARLLALWTRPSGPSRCGALAGPGVPRLPRAALPGGPAAVARAGGEAWLREPALPAAAATPGHDPLQRPVAAGRSEAQKLLRLAQPERRRLAGRAPVPSPRSPRPYTREVRGRREGHCGGGRGTRGHWKRCGGRGASTWASPPGARTERACCSGVEPAGPPGICSQS